MNCAPLHSSQPRGADPALSARRLDELKTIFHHGGRRECIRCFKAAPFKQDSLIFVRRIDYSPPCGEINHPILFDWIAGFDGAACAAKKR